MKLLIVESPNKIKKIRSFLPSDYRVGASFGHVRDLPATGDLAVAFQEGQVIPRYEALEKSSKNVRELQQMAKGVDEILLATDPDREGEAIAWHLTALLGQRTYRRVTFNQITAKAVNAALQAPRTLDQHLVDAQQARRVLDRVVGWVVSPTLKRGLRDRAAKSAGRVQSVALRLVAEREKEIQGHDKKTFFTLDADLEAPNAPPPFTARLVEWKGDPLEHRLAEASLAERTADWCRKQTWQVESLVYKETRKKAPPPFVTATVQQAASVGLKMKPQACMKALQQLFEGGHITYHRTDSPTLSPEAETMARNIIAKTYGQQYLPPKPNKFAAKGANTQEAHEAIRPTHPDSGPNGVPGPNADLYKLIWERYVASQMIPGVDRHGLLRSAIAPASFEHSDKGRVAMGIVEAKSTQVLEKGWRLIGTDATEEKKRKAKDELGEAKKLPAVKAGDDLKLLDVRVVERATKAKPRFTQASLIKRLEQLGIGRPSTYAAIMGTIVDRGYVLEKARKLHCTDLGLKITDYLVKEFSGNFIEIAFTAQLEKDLDRIANGEIAWEGTVTNAAVTVRDLAQRAGLPYDPLSGEKPQPAKPAEGVGPCPLCGKRLFSRTSRFGPFLACEDRSCPAILNPDGTPNPKTQRLIDDKKSKGKGKGKGKDRS